MNANIRAPSAPLGSHNRFPVPGGSVWAAVFGHPPHDFGGQIRSSWNVETGPDPSFGQVSATGSVVGGDPSGPQLAGVGCRLAVFFCAGRCRGGPRGSALRGSLRGPGSGGGSRRPGSTSPVFGGDYQPLAAQPSHSRACVAIEFPFNQVQHAPMVPAFEVSPGADQALPNRQRAPPENPFCRIARSFPVRDRRRFPSSRGATSAIKLGQSMSTAGR